ncbi:acyltransferase family protein [Jiella marina]|uniref:acyltransferase family protein n=1 Tax=Jiella sp. LLJ827 TaxID=2917712 RepID=UPI0021009444|nr:acyltransferase [Jiella sp. LLJ827]MCQ0988327.1 acyltransferase [Jiella sp. LLJ827]
MHYRIIDCWRFVAAMLVMAYHFLYSAPYGMETGTAFLHRLLPLLDLFFMISGYFITVRYAERVVDLRSYGAFLRRRLARLYPLHLLITLFFAAVALYAWSIGAKHYPWAAALEDLPFHIFGLHALGLTDELALNYVSWSISAELFSYVMFPLIPLALGMGGLRGLVGLVALWIVGLEVLSASGFFPSGHWTTADTHGAYRAFADFLVGGAVAVFVQRRIVHVTSHWPSIALIGAALAAMIVHIPYYVVFPLLASALACSALAETARPDSTAFLGPLMPVTRVSFGIYIWHPVLEFFFLEVLWSRWLVSLNVIDFYVYWLLPMAATIVVAILSDRFVESRLAKLVAPPPPKKLDHRAGLAAA